MSSVVYFVPDWAPPGRQYFRCDRLAATITPDACATNWRRSAEGASLRCRGCQIGPQHAGEADANTSTMRGQLVCARCQRGASRLVEGWLDVSCYNRQREWCLQRNARGVPPTKMLPLEPRSILYTEAGETKTLRKAWSQSREELMFGLLRDCAGRLVFHFDGRANVRAAIKQRSCGDVGN